MTASNATCAVCKKPARYKLPKTEVPYCSVVCFRQLSQLGNTVASSLNPDGESSVVPLPPASESFQTAKGEVDEERDKQFLQLVHFYAGISSRQKLLSRTSRHCPIRRPDRKSCSCKKAREIRAV
ncbi:hypothetical protein Gasu_07150 isoform 1 [Galdieria sulphuraria]|uniref:HIT-type domain-containing protein n=1 Tax=Galdieria sulphuraria TaxID=130081 RepID=M2X645_GALSU|nr:hypothetical protein Gasu_07150 isoform 1 [Galdieria sulphuraria]EME31965.1 hypothetical protein Gasu_07150 isoform 1 [Galdieria sulphuraria]|eukprot:XP_005708485.1 hypothetical protein isoform 1 [Galdieria sulphuraria]